MKIKRLISQLLCICMILSMLPMVSVFAVDDNITYLLDTSKKNTLVKAGYTVNNKNVNSTKYSVEWDPCEAARFTLKDVTDISQHDTINFSLYADSTEKAVIMLYVGSENKRTDGIDYYAKILQLNPGEWYNFSIPYTQLEANREPLGFDQLSELQLASTGWSNKVAEGTKIYIDNMYLSGEPTTIKGGFVSDVNSAANLFNENDPVGENIHYNSGGFEAKNAKAGGTPKTNKFEIAADENGNHYLLCETIDNASDYHWDLSLSEVTRYMVFEFDITTSSSLPNGNIQYKDVNNQTAPIIANYGENALKFKDGQSVGIKKGEWTNIAIVFDFLKNLHSVYVDGEKKISDLYFSDKPSISSIRFYFGKNNEIGSNMMIDNFKVYEGAAPREVANEVVDNKPPKVTMNNNAAVVELKDVVALSVGGRGIHYNDEKHPLDAPAYIDNGRTLIPVRAVSEAFGLDVAWDADSRTVTIDNKSKIVIDSTEMILPDGSSYTLDVPAQITNDRTFIPLRALCEKILGKTVTWHEKGIIVVSDSPFSVNDANADTINNYLLYDRPTKEQITQIFNEYNKNSHPRIMMDRQLYDSVCHKYQTDPDVKKWGDYIIQAAEADILKPLPIYTINTSGDLLLVSRDVYQRTQNICMAYILTKDAKYAEAIYDVYEAAGSFPDWHPGHFLDVAEMTCAFAIGYDWLYDYWSDEQKAFLENAIYMNGVSTMLDSQYNNLPEGGLGAGNVTNWNVVCNGGCLMGAVAIFDKYPEECADMIAISIRDTEAMMASFYPDGAWEEGIGYWGYTLAYTVNMFQTLEACFGTDFNLSKAPGFSNTINFHLAGDGSLGINNLHDADVSHGSESAYFWLSNKFNVPGVTNVRLYQLESGITEPTAFDLLWYDTSIKGTNFYLPKDSYLRGVEFVSMRQSWTDENGAWLSYHGGTAVFNHSHLDTGTFVFDLAGIRWAQDLGPDNYNLPGYFSFTDKHKYYRLRPEGHNVYVIDPDATEGQTTEHFAEVESLVSNQKGAYSVLDMTPAYSKWTKKARRGFMLTDDRRSAVIRDEIEFNKEGREFIWFMHTPLSAEIEIADKNTAYITSKGVTLKFMIDSDIANYEFGVMDALPLSTSPASDAQSKNPGVKKLYLKGVADDSNYVECKMILANDPHADVPLSNIKIDEWTIPDGDMQEIPVLDMIYVDGKEIDKFSPTNVSYGRIIRFDDTSSVEITAKAAEGLLTEVSYGKTYADPVTVKVYYANDPGTYRVYTYKTTVLPELVDVGEYDRMQVVEHIASAEPEETHPAINVSNNDIDPESRWAAEGDVWMVLDMGKEEVIDAVGISAWKGGERAYKFKIEVSADGNSWSEVLAERETDKSNGENIGIYEFSGGAVNARYVRYSGSGNSANKWNSLMEIAILKKK